MAYGYYYGGFAPYVPVAERRKRAARKLAQLRKKGHEPKPVEIDGRAIAEHVLGQGLVRPPRVARRSREPPAARPDLRAERLGDRPADRRGRGARARLRAASSTR